jgi:outer membrane protein OmpA-like peptidoglycan-associated protein
MDQLRGERRVTTEGGTTVIREPDRTIIREGNQTIIRHSEVDRFRYGAQDVRVQRQGVNNETIVVRPNGDRVVTINDPNGLLLRRSRIMPNGQEIVIVNNAPAYAARGAGGPGFGGPGGRPGGPGGPGGSGFGPGGALIAGAVIGAGLALGASHFFVDVPPPVVRMPRERYILDDDRGDPRMFYDTLMEGPVERLDRPYSLDEIRYSEPLRAYMPRIDLNTVTFDLGAWELSPEQVDRLGGIADAINRSIQRNPAEMYLIEGHTDATGNPDDNLSLSDRRAEAVAVALTQQFSVPAENLSTQGYGQQYLKVQTDGPERANRRVTVRRITPLLAGKQ